MNNNLTRYNQKNNMLDMDIGNEFHSLYTKVQGQSVNHRVFIDSFMEDGNGLHGMFNTLLEAQPQDTLELRINSNGGIISELQQFHSIIENKFMERSTTILDPKGFSCGAMIFCMGYTRIVHEHSQIMFHDFATGMYGKGGDLEDYLKHSATYLRSFFQTICGVYLTDKEWKRMLDGKEWWFDTKDMCERKIATHVMMNGNLVPAEAYLIYLEEQERVKKDPSLEMVLSIAYKQVDNMPLTKDEESFLGDKKNLKRVKKEIKRIQLNDSANAEAEELLSGIGI